MTPPRHTLSLADVARLADVHRPVVSMWRKRELDGFPFPSPNAEGRFLHVEVAEWLAQTGRGNNPYARADLALYAATSATSNPEECSGLRDLLAARVLTDVPLSTFDLDYFIATDETFRLEAIQQMVGSSGRQRVKATDLADLTMLLTDDPAAIQVFGAAAGPQSDLAQSLSNESLKLSELRDTLLPALMDGTIRVKDSVTHAEKVL